jgi:predicted NAD/FAD-dependent oxidoreductase
LKGASPIRNVAIIGAGLAGIACGARLAAANLEVALFDKGRRPGGRFSTRRVDDLRFDHGAAYLREAQRIGEPAALSLAEWRPRGREVADPVWVGVPGMSALPSALAADLDVHSGVRVEGLEGEPGAWSLVDDAGRGLGIFQAVAVAVPAPQAVPLLTAAPRLREAARSAAMAPCWTGMFAFKEPLAVDIDVIRPGDGVAERAVRNSAKPDRPSEMDCWVVYGDDNWSHDHLEDDKETVAEALLESLTRAAGTGPRLLHYRAAHRWRYARALPPFAGPAFDADALLGICGDWTSGPAGENAVESGWTLADLVLKSR